MAARPRDSYRAAGSSSAAPSPDARRPRCDRAAPIPARPIDPARTGPNQVHLYLLRAKDGAPFTGTKELTVKATLPSRGIGPLALTMHRAGPGHYVADAVTLSPGGDWKLAVTDRVSDFDEYTTTVKAAVR